MKHIALLAAAGLALTACEQTTRTTIVAPTCDAAPYQQWVGKDSASLAGMQTPYTLRTIRPNQPVTMDYNPARLNVETDARGLVTAVRCG